MYAKDEAIKDKESLSRVVKVNFGVLFVCGFAEVKYGLMLIKFENMIYVAMKRFCVEF